MEKIVCGPDNLKDFNARLRNLSPEFYGLAKELHQSGLLQGLGGATIQTGFDVVKSDGEEVQPKSSNTCKQCGHWERDSVGDGSGIGICLLGAMPGKLKWPKQMACKKFMERCDE